MDQTREPWGESLLALITTSSRNKNLIDLIAECWSHSPAPPPLSVKNHKLKEKRKDRFTRSLIDSWLYFNISQGETSLTQLTLLITFDGFDFSLWIDIVCSERLFAIIWGSLFTLSNESTNQNTALILSYPNKDVTKIIFLKFVCNNGRQLILRALSIIASLYPCLNILINTKRSWKSLEMLE